MITSFFEKKSTSTRSKRSRDDDNESNNNKRTKTTAVAPEVAEMLKHLDGAGDNEAEEGTWAQALKKHTSGSSFASLAKFVAKQREENTVFPPPKDTFTALNHTPLSDVKVVIVGQDPYHGPRQAHGLCFSVLKGIAVPPSLKNMYKELANDRNVDFPRGGGKNIPKHGNLERWAKQGVLLLNTVLTVRKGEPHSHKKKGWEAFTDEVIRVLLRECKKKNKRLVFLLWGKPAAEKATAIIGKTSKEHTIIQSSHPSPLGAAKTKAPFLGSKCFGRANEALTGMGLEPIDWNVDDEEEETES